MASPTTAAVANLVRSAEATYPLAHSLTFETLQSGAEQKRCRSPSTKPESDDLFTPFGGLIILLPSFLFFPDAMHLLDCNGTTSLVIGDVLHFALRDHKLGANKRARLRAINKMENNWYATREPTSRLPDLI